MTESNKLSNIRIVLHHPRYPENIGAAARAMRNMGIRDLAVVAPENFDTYRILTLATHAAADVANAIQQYDSLADAVADCGYVVGTTARLGKDRQVVSSPEIMAQRLIPITCDNQTAIVFGPEDRGLTNAELRLCHALVNIPTETFSSINLAHSVMILCYEIFKATRPPRQEFAPRLATRKELDIMYEQFKDVLIRISYIQPDNPDHWMDRFRKFFSRLPLRAREVSVIRGICRQIDWYAGKCYRDGKNGRPPDPALKIDSSEDKTAEDC